MDLKNLSLPELTRLLTVLPAEIKRRRESERKSVINEMRALVAKRGFNFDDLVNGMVTTQEPIKELGKTLPVKYRHPHDSALQWTGRGRKPLWVVQWEAEGHALSELKI